MLSVIFFILTTTLPGTAIAVRLCPHTLTWLRALAVSYGIGAALVTFELFIYFVIVRQDYSVGLYWFFGIQAGLAAAYGAYRLPWKGQVASWPRWRLLPILTGLAIAGILFLALVQAVGKPPVAFDSIAFWAMRAKILMTDGQVDFNPDSLTYLSAYSHSNYPWHVSFLEYWQRLLGGSGGTVNIISWAYFLSLAALLGDFLVKRLGAVKGLVLTLMVCSQPLLLYHASNNYADLIIGYYVAAGFIFFLEWLEAGRVRFLYMAAAFLGWTICIKNYGIFYIIAGLAGVMAAYWLKVHSLNRRESLKAFLCLILPLLPLGLFKAILRLNLRNSDPAWVFHPEALRPFGQALFIAGNWNIWWFVVLGIGVTAFVIARRRKLLAVPWLMFGVVCLILVFVFTCTENYQWALDHTALSRAFIPLVPLSAALAGFSLKVVDDDRRQS